MHMHYDEDEYETVVSRHTCAFHKANPGKSFAGCTCSSGITSVRRPPAEVARIKADRLLKEEDEILARAEAIKKRRAYTGQ